MTEFCQTFLLPHMFLFATLQPEVQPKKWQMISQKIETFPPDGLGDKINPKSFKEKWKRLSWIDLVKSVRTCLDWTDWVSLHMAVVPGVRVSEA